jgi:hypothetical protein
MLMSNPSVSVAPMRLLRVPSRLAAAFLPSSTGGAFASVCPILPAGVLLVSLAGCTGLVDIPDNPRLVVPPDSSMPVIRTEPARGDDPAPGSVSSPTEPAPEAAPPVSPALNANDTSDRNIEDERSDAGAPAFDAGIPLPNEPTVPPPGTLCPEPESLGPNGRCFVVTATLLSWADARLECRSRGPGWDLASIRDDAVNQFMGELGAGEAWVGASDADTEGLWLWVGDGTPFWRGDGATGSAIGAAYENWNSDEPNGRNNSACARLVFTANAAPNPAPAWADLECFELLRSVCDGPPL